MSVLRRTAAWLGSLVLGLGGCEQPPDVGAIPEMSSGGQEGFHDLVFRIRESRRLPDGSPSLLAAATHAGRSVAFEAVFAGEWKASSPDAAPNLVLRQGFVALRSSGAKSDAFVQALDEIYGTRLAPKSMNAETRFAAISLEGEPSDPSKGPVKLKLFFENGNEDDYAELYLNADQKKQVLEIAEKDEEYRAAIVRALCTNP